MLNASLSHLMKFEEDLFGQVSNMKTVLYSLPAVVKGAFSPPPEVLVRTKMNMSGNPV